MVESSRRTIKVEIKEFSNLKITTLQAHRLNFRHSIKIFKMLLPLNLNFNTKPSKNKVISNLYF